MDFGIGFLSNNVMLPILDFFYGVVPSYGLAIVALTLVIRLALYPLSAGSIRNMRRMKVTQPIMKKRQEEIQKRYKDDKVKQQEELNKLFQEFGNPLAGCLPVLVQMPVLFALFATLRGSPFADVNYNINLQILPQPEIQQVIPQAFATPAQNIYFTDNGHTQVTAILPGGTKIGVGEKVKPEFQTVDGNSFATLLADYPDSDLSPKFKVIKGEDKVQINEDGTIAALQPGDVTIQATMPGLAANKGFLFIEALGRVGAFSDNGVIHWDVIAMILAFGISLYVNQLLSGQGGSSDNPQQDTVNRVTPIIFSGMFLFFPLPAGVLMYMVIANIFQTAQTFILSKEPLPENIQKIVDAETKTIDVKSNASASSSSTDKSKGRQALPFEPGQSTKKKSS